MDTGVFKVNIVPCFSSRLLVSVIALTAVAGPMATADIWDFLGLRKRANAAVAVTEEQLTAGLKEALAHGVENAVTNLGRAGGFLSDASVKIPIPAKLQWAESALRAVGKEGLVTEFVESMNRAAEAAVPASASVLGDAVRQMTIADARDILESTNTAATAFFERTSRDNLQKKLLPLVQGATDKVGVTASYKRMVDQAGLKNLGALGSLGRSLIGTDTLDLDTYVTDKALNGLFLKIGEEEKRIRQNPAARTTELLQKVFGKVAR